VYREREKERERKREKTERKVFFHFFSKKLTPAKNFLKFQKIGKFPDESVRIKGNKFTM
jgi:hypothetical protein